MAQSELARGTRLGKYEIHGRLSVGGMAELYLASLAGQGGFRKFVALKRVLPSIAEDESFIQMFLDEARITASLSHASIAQVYELTEDPNSHEPVLVMEFVAGQNLDQLISRAHKRALAVPVEFTCRVAHDVLLALHSAHGFVEPSTGAPMPVIHRDINPRNVMVTYTGGTKIVDFGIAKARGRLNQTQVGYVKGTIQYMSPEQITAKEVTGRTDLFAASILFYELLAGRRLFGEEGSDAATMTRIVTGEVPHLARVVPRIPEALADAVMKGLEKDPSRRWKNGREYARAVDRAMPESWDDQQVSEFMGRLFEDKIAVTRGLLTSSNAEASPRDLRLMTMMGEEESEASRGAAPFDEVPTNPSRPAEQATDHTEQNLPPVGEAPAEARAAPPAPRDTSPSRPPALARDATLGAPPHAPAKSSDSNRAALESEVTQTRRPHVPQRKRTGVDEPTAAPPRRRTQDVAATRTRSRPEEAVAPQSTPRGKGRASPVARYALYALLAVLGLVVLAEVLYLALGGAGEEPKDKGLPPKTPPALKLKQD